MPVKKILLIHNLLWSSYKGAVFSKLVKLDANYQFDIIQIAETDNDRTLLSDINLNFHKYNYTLIFNGSISSVSIILRIYKLSILIINSKHNLILLPGYHLIEYWFMWFFCVILKKNFGVFCDSTRYDRKQNKIKGIFKKIFFSKCYGFFCYGIRSREYLKLYGANADFIFERCQSSALPDDYNILDIISYRERNFSSIYKYLFVGSLNDRKGIHNLLVSFNKLLELYPDSILNIVGDGELKNYINSYISQNELFDSIHLLGSLDIYQLSVVYCDSDALVLPSHSECWGLVVNEALSYGCNVVVSDICGCIPELVIPGVTGYVFNNTSYEDLIDKLIKVRNLKNKCNNIKNLYNVINEFTPDNAALQILNGCSILIDK